MRKLRVDELNRLSIEDFKSKKKNPITVVLDNVRSMNNVGSAFRTGDAFLIDRIVLCGITARPPHREIHKTALGATDSVDWVYFEKTEEAIEYLKKENFEIISIEQAENSTPLDQFEPKKNRQHAFVFGNEAFWCGRYVATTLVQLHRNPSVWNKTLFKCVSIYRNSSLGCTAKVFLIRLILSILSNFNHF